ATAAASATVRLANGEAASGEAQTTPAPASMADLASTVSYLKTLETELKTQSEALNGDNPEEKTAYYKLVDGRTLYWDGFMPKIVLEGFDSTWGRNSDNQDKIRAWFGDAANWAGL
ncbi:hypothetical protein ACJOMI_03820, partial [Mycoplasmopsis synoviae]